MKKYFLQNNGQKDGPFSLEELKALKISPNTLIWYEGIKDWEKISNDKELHEKLFPQTIEVNENESSIAIAFSQFKFVLNSGYSWTIGAVVLLGLLGWVFTIGQLVMPVTRAILIAIFDDNRVVQNPVWSIDRIIKYGNTFSFIISIALCLYIKYKIQIVQRTKRIELSENPSFKEWRLSYDSAPFFLIGIFVPLIYELVIFFLRIFT